MWCAPLQVRAAYNPQRQIVNNNFKLIKAFIHHWRAAVPVPLPALLSLLGATPAKPASGAPDAKARRKAAEQRCVAMKLLAAGEPYRTAKNSSRTLKYQIKLGLSRTYPALRRIRCKHYVLLHVTVSYGTV